MNLPNNVIETLMKGKKIEAIKLLRKEQNIGLKEAKDIVDAYQRHEGINASFPVTQAKCDNDTTRPETHELPDEVVDALMNGKKITAISLLRKKQDIGLAEAKAMVEAYQVDQQSLGQSVNRGYSNRTRYQTKGVLITMAVVASFVWGMINIVNVSASIIVLINHDGYNKSTFTIDKIYYNNDHESGLIWGFTGTLPDRNERLYAPSLADAKSLKYRGLSAMFPPGTKMDVWYNPQVTDTLFQHRTLRVIPYTPDLAASEAEQIIWWAKYCLSPFLIIIILASKLRKSDQNDNASARKRYHNK